ncbi:hypothetical protein GDO81_025811 [Engystomops pustulosus]|uniref:Uncharacterized protein n=1 Tax=Engystomops pustulosus TaxID=76066 RepID=A0AAV6YRS4_ENGPU|nr:hypothetical protein GDO81_025811 [Engystomops pustulosus]
MLPRDTAAGQCPPLHSLPLPLQPGNMRRRERTAGARSRCTVSTEECSRRAGAALCVYGTGSRQAALGH